MTRVALRGITTRRLRTALTALAIVLGVAMVSGSYTLTDTMRGAADSLSSSAYDGTAAVVSAKTAFKVDEEFAVRPSIPASDLEQVQAVPGVEKAVGSITDEARIVGQGRRHRRHRPVLRHRSRPAGRQALPLQAEGGQLRLRSRSGRDRRRHRRPRGILGRRQDRHPGPRARAQARGQRHRHVRRRGLDRHGDVRAVRPARRADAVPEAGPLHRDPRRRARLGPQAALGVARRLASGPDGGRSRPLHARRAEDVRELPEGVPARVRRHRRVRGRVHDLQHALDHGRAALA